MVVSGTVKSDRLTGAPQMDIEEPHSVPFFINMVFSAPSSVVNGDSLGEDGFSDAWSS